MVKFRFQDFEIWKDSIEITDKLFDISDKLEERKLFRFAEQLRGAGMSISNNIAEGSGSFSNKDLANYLNMARRSAFENVNILMILKRRNLVEKSMCESLIDKLGHLCSKITNFRKALFKL